MSWRGALALCVLVGLAAGSIHVALGAVMSPLPVARSGPLGPSEVAAILPALHEAAAQAFAPESLIVGPLFAPNCSPH